MNQRRNLVRILSAASLVAALAVLAGPGCETYDSPPRPSIDGIVDGVLQDPSAPLVLRFSEPVDPTTLRVSIIRYETTAEGLLLDEDADPDNDSDYLEYFAYHPDTGNLLGEGKFIDDYTAFQMAPPVPFPIGPSIAVVIEPGLSDLKGRVQQNRLRLVFTFGADCANAAGTDAFPSGTYFFIANVTRPIPVQIQLWGRLEVDAATGKVIGRFTNADRNPDPTRCSPPCKESEACRLLPAQQCVVPSMEAIGEDEFSDFVPNDVLPTGYSFLVEGCLIPTDLGVTFLNLPADVVIQQPAVIVEGIELLASFADDGGVLRGTGGVVAEDVIIGVDPSGKAEGTVLARLVPEDEVPPGIPGP